MLALFFLLAALFLAATLVRRLPIAMTGMEAAAMTAVLGVIVGSWTAFGASFLVGYAAAPWMGMGILVIAGAILIGKRGIRLMRLDLEPPVRVLVWLGGGVLALAGAILVRNHYLLDVGGSYFSGGYTWADLALHMSLASFFAEQPAPSLAFPLYHGAETAYPFLADFLSGFLARFGFSWPAAFWVPTALLLFGWTVGLVALVRRLLNQLGAAVLHLSFMLFSGSTAAIWLFMEEYGRTGAGAWLLADYSNIGDREHVYFANLVNSHLLPQRSYLMGSALFFIIIWLVWEWRRTRSRALALTAGALAAMLPFVHVHSFFVLFGVAVALKVYRLVFERKTLPPWREWWPFLLALLAVPQVIWQMNVGVASEFLSVHAWWMTPEGTSPLIFWWRNAGAGLLLVVLSLAVWRRFTDPTARALVISGAALFVLCNIFQFQPNLWDNMKFLTYAYLFLMLPVAVLVAEGFKRLWGVAPAALAVAVLTVPGLLTLNRELSLRYEFLTADDRTFAEYVRTETSPDALFLIGERHNHPVTTLAGRKVLLGYMGWLWSYGIDVEPYRLDRLSILGGSAEAADLIARHGISYIAVHDKEKAHLGFNEAYYRDNARLVSKTGPWELYDVRK